MRQHTIMQRMFRPRRLEGVSFIMALSIALLLDLIDYAVIGMIPWFGDVFDLVAIVALFPFIGSYAFVGVLELIPGVDVVPTYIIAVIMVRYMGRKRRR